MLAAAGEKPLLIRRSATDFRLGNLALRHNSPAARRRLAKAENTCIPLGFRRWNLFSMQMFPKTVY
jgi:hypothetical protein